MTGFGRDVSQESSRIVAANAMGRLLGDEHGAEVLTGLRTLGWTGTVGAAYPDVHRHEAHAEPRIGVWNIEPSPTGPALVRASGVDGETKVLWADVDAVPGAGEARRVVVVGESTARGYLIDPIFTPTRALEHALARLSPAENYQCIDLARTSLDIEGLRDLLDGLPAVEPDVVVLVIGNNWSISCYERDVLPTLAGAFRIGGLSALKDEFRRAILEPRVDDVLADILELERTTGAQIVLVVPEFNLAGWASGAEFDVIETPAMPGRDMQAWYDERSLAQAALADGRFADVHRHTDVMSRLDRGCSPIPWELTALASLGDGDVATARSAFEACRDSVYGTTLKYLPRTPTWLQDKLAAFAVRHGMGVVDMREVLARGGNHPGLPDPDLFYDYCHLTDTGFQLLMVEVARTIAVGPITERSVTSPVSPRDRATGYLLAAVYNSFCGQPSSIVEGCVRRAEEECDVSDLLGALAALVERPGPAWADPSFDVLTSAPNLARLFERLSQSRPEMSRLWTLHRLLPRPAVTSSRPRDLVEVADGYLGLGRIPNRTLSRCFLRATTRRTLLPFSVDRSSAVCLRLTYRTRCAQRASTVVVALNGRCIASVPVEYSWHSVVLDLPSDAVRIGVNNVEIDWPLPIDGYDEQMEADGKALARGEFPDLLPLFGELFEAHITPS